MLLNSPSWDIADLTEHVKAAPDIFDRHKWVKLQASEANHRPTRDIKQDSDGLKHYVLEGTTNCRVIVPVELKLSPNTHMSTLNLSLSLYVTVSEYLSALQLVETHSLPIGQ